MSVATTSAVVVDEIERFNQGLKPKRVRLKLRKMAADPFAFFRGANHLYALAWAELRPPDIGPEILLCGDLHVENFGAYRVEGGEDVFDINDFDEALVGPCSLDLVRCATSLLLAAEGWCLTPLAATGAVLSFLDQYRAAVVGAVATGALGEVVVGREYGPVGALLGARPPGTQLQLLDRHTRATRDGSRRIRRDPAKFPALGKRRFALVRDAIERHGQQTGHPREFRVLDVRARIAGTGSLGLRRYTILIHGGGEPDRYRLLDLKEARPSSLAACTGHPQPDSGGDEARRVVAAQRHLQARPPALLEALAIEGVHYRLREMVPDENRSDLNQLANRPKRLRKAVEVAGRVVGWAQVRGSRSHDLDRSAALADWTSGPALESVLAAAVRFADLTRRQYHEFHAAYTDGRFEGLGRRYLRSGGWPGQARFARLAPATLAAYFPFPCGLMIRPRARSLVTVAPAASVSATKLYWSGWTLVLPRTVTRTFWTVWPGLKVRVPCAAV